MHLDQGISPGHQMSSVTAFLASPLDFSKSSSDSLNLHVQAHAHRDTSMKTHMCACTHIHTCTHLSMYTHRLKKKSIFCRFMQKNLRLKNVSKVTKLLTEWQNSGLYTFSSTLSGSV